MSWLQSLQLGFLVLCVSMSLAFSVSLFYLFISLINRYIKLPKTTTRKTQRTKKKKEPETVIEDIPVNKPQALKPMTEDVPFKFKPKSIQVESSFGDGKLGKVEQVSNNGG